MDFNQLEAFLTSQTKKKDGGISEDQSQAFVKFWKSHKTKIHDKIIAENTWNSTLKKLSWRIDMKTQARHIEQINTPVAIIEMELTTANKKEQIEVLRFEMDETQIKEMIKSVEEIETRISDLCQQ